jgi:erythritol transport system ATP-binding protein
MGISSDVIIKARGVVKAYPGTMALKAVDYDVYRGKVNVLVGENGAGKSTLMKILAGVESMTSGNLFLNDREVSFGSPNDAAAEGIGIVYQEMNLFPNMSVAENVFIKKELRNPLGGIDHRKQEKTTRALMQKLKQDIDPSMLVSELRVGQQQVVEIAKAISRDADILIMDEPTSALSATEVEVLFSTIRELKSQGVTIIYISHRLEELIEIGDCITVLRDGFIVETEEIRKIDLKWIVEKMVGGDSKKIFKAEKHNAGDTILAVKNLCLPREGGGYQVDHASFELKKGEVLGFYGLMGAGRSELLECLLGDHPEATGEIFLDGEKLERHTIKGRIEAGFALVPEDRQRSGLVQTMSVLENMTLASLWKRIRMLIQIDFAEEDKQVGKQVGDMSIKIAHPKIGIMSLSGGNQQKVVIGKSLMTNPKILLLDEPTRGIDVGAKAEVFSIINDLANKGLSIIYVSSELMEIMEISDRTVVMSNGKITGLFERDTMTETDLVKASAVGHKLANR